MGDWLKTLSDRSKTPEQRSSEASFVKELNKPKFSYTGGIAQPIIPPVKKPQTFMDGLKDGLSNWNPKNWGVEDYSDKSDRGLAYSSARQAGEKEFMYQGKRYNTNYAGTPSQQLSETGITDSQLQGTNNPIRNRLAENLSPFGYGNSFNRIKEAVWDNKKDNERVSNENRKGNFSYDDFGKRRLDAFALYTGHPQKNNTFSISNHKPSNSKDKNAIYYSITTDDLKNRILDRVGKDGKLTNKKNKGDKKVIDTDGDVMGNYTLSEGEDKKGKYISYYDKWDIAPVDFGKPMEIYDRIYLNEKKNKQTKK